jgi:hypothetical protein
MQYVQNCTIKESGTQRHPFTPLPLSLPCIVQDKIRYTEAMAQYKAGGGGAEGGGGEEEEEEEEEA